MSLSAHQLKEITMAIVFPSDAELLNGLYRHFCNASDSFSFKFFFVLPGSGWMGDKGADIGRFFFLPNYCFQDGNTPVLAFMKAAPEETKEFRQWCCSQGLDEPRVLVAKDFSGMSQPTGVLSGITKEQREQYLELVSSPRAVLEWAPQPVVMQITDGEDLKSLREKLSSFNGYMEKENPELYMLLLTLARMEEERKSDKAALKHLRQEVENLKVFNKELRATNETENILNFYHTQYEVLPLWYKRFGHVIKILMGKRKLSFATNKEER